MSKRNKAIAAFVLLFLLPVNVCQAAPEAIGDFFGIMMVSQTRAAHFSSEGFVRGELGDGMDKRVYARANFDKGRISLEIYNGLDIPLTAKNDYRALTLLTHDRKYYEYELKTGNKASIAPKKHATLRMADRFQGKKEDIKLIVCRLNLGDVKVVFVPAGPTSWESVVARASDGVPAAPPAAALAQEPAPQEGVVFRIENVSFRGNKSIPTAELEAIAAPFLNSDIRFTALQDMVSELKRYYRSKGYLAAYAYLPEQKVSSGTVEVEIFEGDLGTVKVEGNKFVSDKAVKKYFDNLQPGQALKYEALQQDLGRLNRNPDIKAAAVLQPGATTGTTDAKLDVEDKRPVHVSVDANNLGAPTTGRNRFGTTYTNNNLFGNTEALTVRGQAGRDAGAVSVDYNVPIHFMDARLGGSYTHAYNEVGSGDFRDLGIRGNVDAYSLYALRPLIMKPGFDLTGKLGFDWKSSENKILGAVSGEDELREISMGLSLEHHDASGATFSPHSIIVGLDALGASTSSDPVTNAGADGSFVIYRGSLVRQQRLTDRISLQLRETTQIASGALPPVERMVLGGAYSVRGYSQSSFLGDRGISGTAELHVGGFFPQSFKVPFTGEPLNKAFEWVGFLDAGYAQKEDALLGEKENVTLYSAGAGFRVHLFDRVYARAEWAEPISEGNLTGDDGIVSYFGISVELY